MKAMLSKRSLMVSSLGIGVVAILIVYLHHSRSTNPYWTPSPGVMPIPARVNMETPSTITFSPADLRSNVQVKLLIAKAEDILAALKKTGETQHLDFARPDSFQPDSGEISGTSYSAPEVELKSADYSFHFREHDNFFASFINDGAFRLITGKEIVPTATPDKPKWSEEQAVQIGMAFLKCLVDTSHYAFTPGRATYDSHTDMRDRQLVYYAGSWMVTWARVDPQGVPYASNGARMHISEKWGVTDAVLWLDGIYVEQKGERMSAEIAIKIAKHSRPALATSAADIVDYNVTSCELVLVQPYRLGGNSWRLAYMIWMRPVRSPPPRPGPTYNDSQEVTVDALTGQIIGENHIM